MIEPILFLGTDYTLKAATEEDLAMLRTYKPNQAIRAQLTGARKIRSYRELSCYFGSCRYIASLRLNAHMRTQEKVDRMTRVHCGFVEGPFYDAKHDRVYWIPKSLGYRNCDQPEAHDFISEGLERHAYLAGVKVPAGAPSSIRPVDVYVDNLRTL